MQHRPPDFGQVANFRSAIPMTFPNYTVPLKVLLSMEKMRPHEELMEEDLLVEFDSSMGKAAFISHQWISATNPDPEFAQMKTFQDALKNMLSKGKWIYPDIATEYNTRGRSLHLSELRTKPLFFWYDYFSIPQLLDSKWFVNSLQMCSQDRAIQSIPAYIDRCELFFVLCPMVESEDRTELLGPSTWESRGWCRMERQLRELLPAKAYVVVRSHVNYEVVASPITSFGGMPGEGSFGFSEDRKKLGVVLRQFLERLIERQLREGDLEGYRMYLNLQDWYLRGFPRYESISFLSAGDDVSDPCERFLYENGFNHINEVDRAGWSPFCYATMRGDPALVRSFLERRANPNDTTKKTHNRIGIMAGQCVLSICTWWHHNEAAQLLLDAKADFSIGVIPSMQLAAHKDNVEGIRLLCRAGDEPHRPSRLPALWLASALNSVAAVKELFVQSNGKLSLSGALHAAMIHRGGTCEMVAQLLELRADVNEPYRVPSNSFVGLLYLSQSFQYRLGAQRTGARLGYHSFDATPLMVAVITGQYEGAMALLTAKARVDLRNTRKKTALDLALELDAPSFLIEALEGETAVCCRMVLSAMNNRYPVAKTL